jgi:glyoxalase family protein
MTPIQGLHHVTAITHDAQKNINFYTQSLGQRLVKLTINYDDPQTYHLYYGDGTGSPGTIMTFFAWPGRRGTAGTGQVTETAFAVPEGAIDWWQNRLPGQVTTRFGHKTYLIHDPDELPLALIETPAAPESLAWRDGGPPLEYAIRGFHGVTLTETEARLPASVLVERFGYRETGREDNRIRYESEGAHARAVDVLTQERLPVRLGPGQVHHVAFRVPTDDAQATWLRQLRADGLPVSPVMDRDYFHSIYFREPGGVRFEIATDAPGFTVDESATALGTHLMLPPWLEARRPQLEQALPPLRLPALVKRA